MTPLDRKLVAGDQFCFSSNSPPGVEQGEDYGLAFGEWTGWHGDNYHVSGHHDEPDWLAKLDSKSPVNQPLSPAHYAPTSRVEAIARYKKEMLELVKDAPEYTYELSLRDLVELPRIVRTARDLVELPKIVRAAREPLARERLQKNNSRRGGQEKIKKAGRRHLRSESMESGGFLLKMFFPKPLSGTKRSSRSSSGSLKPSSRSSSSGSSKSGSSSSSSESNSASSSSGTSKSGSNSRVSPRPLMKDARKPGADESSERKCVEMQQNGALSRNCSRYYLMIRNNYPEN